MAAIPKTTIAEAAEAIRKKHAMTHKIHKQSMGTGSQLSGCNSIKVNAQSSKGKTGKASP
jgi:hypothetical protein